MPDIRGLVVCVGFDDLLSVTLPRNMRHMSECLVVTSIGDERTQKLVRTMPSNVHLYLTDAFYENGARFNKGNAVEHGLSQMGRDGWMLIHDADILFPDDLYLPELEIGKLYGLPRRLQSTPKDWVPTTDESKWQHFPLIGGWDDRLMPGYFQLFHADDPVLASRPWYGVHYDNAGRCDDDFQAKWDKRNWFKCSQSSVLHLGPTFENWCGRATERIDGKDDPTIERNSQAMKSFWGRS